MLMTSLLTAFRLDWGATLQWLFGIERAASGGMPPLTSISCGWRRRRIRDGLEKKDGGANYKGHEDMGV